MADEFKIVASLNIPESASRINKDIPKLEGQAKHLKIVADLNPTLSIKNIQATLNKMNNNANIKIGIDTSGFNSTLSDVQNKVVATNKGLSIKPTVDGKVIEDTDVLIKTIVSKLQTLNTVDLKTFKANLKNILGVSNKEVVADAETLIQALKLSPEDTNLIINSYQNLIDSIRNALSGMGKDGIVSGNSFDNNVVMSIFQAATKVEEKTKELGKTATQSAKETQTAVKDTTQVIDKETQAVKVQTDAYDNLALARRTATTDANNNQISRTETYSNSATGKSKTVVYDASDNEQVIKYAENIDKVTMAQERANASAIKLESSYAKVKSRIEDVNVAKPIKDTDNIANLNKQYNIVEQAIEAVRNADSTTMASMKANAEKEISALQNLERQYRNAEYVATELRNKDFNTVKTDQINNEFIAQVNSSKVPIDTMTKDIDELKDALNGIGDKDSLTKFLNQFDNAKSKFESVKATYQSIADKIKELQRIQNSGTFNKNSSDSTVINLKQQIATLLTEYERLKTQLNGNVTPQGITDIGNQLTQLNARFNDATTTAKRFETELRNDNGAEQLAQKVALLTQRIKAYRQANSKSEKMFGSQYDSMLSQLANPNIDLNAYNAINKQFQTMRQEINATNAAGKTLWQTLKEKAGKFVGWMSLTGIISSIWREMQQMVTNVIELDSAMTNLKKVTDETDSTYSRFLKNASSLAKELKMDLSDLVNQTAEWAKKGYSIAESSAASKASGIYSVVGEVDNATAVQDLTTVIKSYNMAIEDSIDIVDRFNNISNKYSVTAADIGEMLSNSISSLSIAGNSLDEAIAMGTTITEITGDASEAGNTLKVLSMRLRGASTEIENAGESTDGMAESTSKLREKILALTNVTGNGGFDIMADADNFKSTYEIMKGISEVWNDISDVNQAKDCLYVQKCA